MNVPTAEQSYWKSFYNKSIYTPLNNDLAVDVVIVGGGITGLTTAYLLKQSGLKVAVLEKNNIGSGSTGGTTGKVTAQHGLIYSELKKYWGEKSAQIYAEASQTAVDQIALLIDKEKIDCDWQQDDNYVYTSDRKQIKKFKAEAHNAASLGLPATFETHLQLPFEVSGAVKFANQGKFNSQKYVLGLAKAVHGNGSYVFEHSNVISFHDGMPAIVKTKLASVTAKNIIVATKVPAGPLLARFSYAALEYPHTSYIVAGHLDQKLTGMYISPDKGHYSILPVENGQERMILIGGERHIPGLGIPSKHYQRLANYAEKHFGVTSLDYHWKAMDYVTYDSVPLIGKVYPWSKHLFTATGFNKWGLGTSMVAGMILTDLITNTHNPWTSTFDSIRMKPIASIPRATAKYFS